MVTADWIPYIPGDSRRVSHNLLSDNRLPGFCARKSRWNWNDNPSVPVGFLTRRVCEPQSAFQCFDQPT